MRFPGEFIYEAGPKPTPEDPLPIGMIGTHRQYGGTFLAEVDPVTLKERRGRPQRFRVTGDSESGGRAVEPVFQGADGRFEARHRNK